MDIGDFVALAFLYVLLGTPFIIYLLKRVKFKPIIKYIYCFATPAVAIALFVLGFKEIEAFSPKLAEEIMDSNNRAETIDQSSLEALAFLPFPSRALGFIPTYYHAKFIKTWLLLICPALGLLLWYLLFYFLNKFSSKSNK